MSTEKVTNTIWSSRTT